nr:carbohydrate binding domain-containing protein [Pseudomonas sp. GW460-LB5]
MKLVTAPIKALYDPVGAFKDVFGGVQGIFAGLTGAAKVSGAGSSEPSSQTVRSSKAPVRFILGRASTGGVLAWIQEQPGDQTSGEWLHIVYVLSEGAIAGVDQIYVDERPLSELGENATSEVIIDPAQVNAFLLANCPDWRQEQIGRGLSFVRLSFKYDAEKFPSGIPDVRFVVRGRRDIYDPRNGSSGYSANTALLILWYLRNRCGIPDDEIIFQSFASAANISDEAVGGPDGTVTPRYFAGAVIGADEKRNTVLDNLLSACAGTLIRVGGRWSLQVGAYYGPADFTINEDMVIGTVEGTTEVSNSDAINTMRGTFVDPAQAWAETDYPEVAIQDWITADGGELAESQSFAYVTDAYLAQRLANISLRRRRSGGSVSMPLNFNGYNCRPGRAVKVDLPSLNILGEFMVTEWTMGAADACKVTLKPYEQAIFDDAVGQPYDPLGFINLPVGGLAAVTGLAWTPSSVAEIIQGVLSWVSPAQTVLSYTVTIRKGTEVVQSLKVGGEAVSCNINGLASGTYAMSVVAFGPGTRSGEASINVNVGGPPVPESCDYFASVDSITLVPVNRQNSLNGGTYEYFHATNPQAPIADAVYLGQGLTFTHTGLAFAKQYFYYVRSANAYGKSDFLYVAAATSDDPTQMLEVIKGEILESHLGQQLTEKIDLIDGNGPGSVNERVGSAKTELAQQISEVNNALATAKGNLEQQITATNQNVADAKSALEQQIAVVDGEVDAAKADLQQKIDSVSVLAGSLPYNKDKTYTTNQGVLGADGKLYQALKAVPKNTPPPNATYWTDVGQAIVTAAGTASRVSKVETDVFTLDGKSTAQASQIGGLQSGLTATNQNVTAAQQAADAANTLAGGKGKVIIQAAAPAVADRLAQNLWIDTTGNANTPKRWNGTTWVAVTDKAASDAAAAAQSALSQVALKADATVVNNVATRVSEAEGKLSSQATRMDGMQTSIDGKASSQALQQVTSRVTGTEQKDAEQDQKLTSQSQALVSLSDSVSKKAEAATVQALSNEVNQHGQDLSAQGQSLTKINAALPLVGGENLVYNPSFERQTDNNGTAQYWWYDSSSNVGSRAPSLVPSTLAAGVAQRLDVTGIPTNGWARVYLRASLKAIKVRAGAVYTASVYMRGTAGLRILAQVYSRNAAGVNGVSWAGARIDAAETWQRVSVTFTATTETFDVWPAAVVYGGDGVTAGFVEVDQYQLEEGAQASGWRDNGQVEASNQAATAAAVDAMSAKVIQHGADLASVSSKTTSLENSLTTTNGNVTTAQQAAQAAADAAGAKGKVLYQSTAPAVADRLAQNLWIDTTGNANTPKRWNGTAWTAVTDKVATDAAAAAQSALSQVALKADASALQTLGSTVSQQGQQITADGQSITRIDTSLSQLKGDVAANASATAGLSGRVTANENALTSVSGQVVQLSNSLGDVGAENLVYNPSFEKQDAGTPGMADGWWHDASGTSVTRTPSLVPSTLASGFAQRLEVAGLTPSTWARVYQRSTRRFKVVPGKTYTASVYLRGTAGLRILPQVYGVNEAGSSSGSWAGSRVDAGEAWTRLSVTFTPDANTSVVYPAFVVYAGASAAAGFIEGDQYQLEEGAVATGWRDNGQVNSANQAATATAVEALNSKVTQQGADLASTSSKTTSLENSLSTTNGNVTAAQTAAQNAAALAGSKGKVIVQAAAPDVADRVAQNLWIDTTGNANTPKRWTGTTWQAVTDKVATDAAAAAQSALSQVALKADASALQTMGSTVSQQGQQLIADGQAITGINASLTQVKADVAANASATSGLSGRVTASENNLASVSGQVVQLNNSLGDVGGENLVYNSSFEEVDPGTPGVGNGWWYDGSAGTRVPSLVPSTVAPGNAQRLDITGLSPSAWARVYVKQSMRFKVTPGQTYTASVYVRGTPGLRVLVAVYNLNAAGSNTASWASVRQDATLDWVRLAVTFVASSDTVLLYPSVVVYGGASVTGGFIEADQYQVERGAVATGWRDNGQVSAGKLAANASATEALSSKVTQQGADLASTSSKTTSLENSLSTTNGNVTAAQTAAQNAAALAGSKGKVIVQAAAPDVADRVAQNLWIDTTGNANTPKRWNGTTWQAVTDKAATDAAAAAQSALSQVALKADASALQTMGTIVAQQGAELVNQAALTTQLKASMAQQSDNLILRGTFEDGLVQPWTASPVVVAVSAHASAGKAIAFYGNSFCGLERNVLTKGGEQFDLSADIFAGYMTSGQIARMQMQFFDKAGAAISYLDAFAVVSGLGSFKAYSGRITAPAGAVSARFLTRLEPSDGSGRALWCNLVARRVSEAEAATANAVSSVTSTVNQQGEKLTAETQRIDVLSASVGSAQAAIQNEITARTNADSALSQQIQTTQSTLGDTTASVQRVSTTLNQLNGVANASEVVKVQITANRIRHVAGFGLSIDNSKGAVQSTFAILADRFAILNPSGDAVSSPFAVVGNQTFISDAYIRDASIGNAKITNGAITTAKIGEAEVDTLRIRGNAVTIPVGAFASASSVSVTVTLDGNYPVFLLGSLTQTYYSDISMTRNGVALWVERPQGSSIASRGVMDYPGPGTHTYTLSSNHAGNTNGASILAVVCKR